MTPSLKPVLDFFRNLSVGTSGKWSFLASLVGLVVGICCICFEYLTQLVRNWALSRISGFPAGDASGEPVLFDSPEIAFSPWLIVSVITVGGLVSGFLVHWLAPEAAGAGTDAALEAFHDRKGIVRGRVIWIKTVASALTLGTGGSGGREGPIAQIGAGVGSWVGQRLGLTPRDRRILLAAGMGAGVGAMFRAPLAGAIFAGEILYSDADMEADVIVPAAIASIVGYSVYTQSIPAEMRYQPIFGGELSHTLGSSAELLPYLLLALFLLALSILYVRWFQYSRNVFDTLPIRPHLRPAIGAMLAGITGVGLYHAFGGNIEVLGVLGTGYGVLQNALTGQTSGISVLAAVAGVKMLTTSLSIGSGGSGGIFGPSMVIGGCAGAAFGQAAHAVVPDLVPYPEAYAVVGMAGFFSGVARAPISTIIMIRELTGDFGLLVPTMMVSTLTFIVSSRWPLYQKQVPSRMESPAHRGDFLVDVLEGLQVEDVYWRDQKLMMINEAASLDEIVHSLAKTTQHYFPVVDKAGKMIGIFSDDDVRGYLYDDTLWRLANAGDVMTTAYVRVVPSDDLNTAMQKFTAMNLDELPVMSEEDPGKLLGFLRRKETIAAYNRRILQHRQDAE